MLKWSTMLNATEKSRRYKEIKSEKNLLDLKNKILTDITFLVIQRRQKLDHS